MAGFDQARRAATAADVTGAYRVLLGREPESAAVLAEKTGQPLADMIPALLGSAEFTEGVASPLLEGRGTPARYEGAPLPADALWIADALPATEETAAAVKAAASWRDLLLSLFADPRFGPAVDALEPAWSRAALVSALSDWTPRRPDAGAREDDWGESIAEREAAMKRDLADRLRLDVGSAPPPPPAGDGPLITVLTPVYDPPLEYLARAVDSVRGQTYARWELVLVDDGSTKPTVRSLLDAYAALDPRIRVVVQGGNTGIAAASNAGLAVARGDWLALLDNDDMLTRDALQHVADAVAARPDADMLYSDEAFVGPDDAPQELFPKPDWSPLLMLNGHYIGHLTVHRTARVRELGGFRSEYDFSQDYDLALRVADADPVVVHIDRILYAWRRIPGSAAAGGKDHARTGNVAALQDALDRRGWGGFAEALPTANRARRRVSPPPPVALVIPSDSAENIAAAVRSITARTWYEAYEVHVVTTSAMAARLRPTLSHPRLRWVPYDRPFNFSDKCNVGARAAAEAGARHVVFFNDDVRVLTPDWIESLLEVATLPGVGAVAPKLLYEDGRVQHAGMVTGVRRLVGTAFHMRPGDSHELQNLGVQSVREVSLLCAALILLPLKVFEAVDGFDAVDFPIAHSDVDLCLRLRERGLSLVYTPHAVLEHIGHVSIGAEEAAVADGTGAHRRPRPKDKADIALLRRFPEALARDPYFPDAVRGLHHRDSEPRFHLHPAMAPRPRKPGARDVLLLSHELTRSGAPQALLDIAAVLLAEGDTVVLASRRDGPMRERFQALGAPVIVDSALFDAGESATVEFGRNFDLVIANTVVSWPAVRLLAPVTKVVWHLHEVGQIGRMAEHHPLLGSTFALARECWAPSRAAAAAVEAFGVSARIMPGAADDPGPATPAGGDRVRVCVLGAYERRKGQDLAVSAWRLLPPELQELGELTFWGRDLEDDHLAHVRALAAGAPGVRVEGELTHGAAQQALRASHVVLVPSREESLSLVALDGLAAGLPVLCSARVGASGWLTDGVSGLLCAEPTPLALAGLLARALADPDLRGRVGRAGRAVFEREFTRPAFSRRLLAAVSELDAGEGLSRRTRTPF